MRIHIDKRTGRLNALYDDRLLPYIDRLCRSLPGLQVRVTRASRVEPAPDNAMGARWRVDLSPSGGPDCVLADEQGRPFEMYRQALDFERRWIEERLGQLPTPV